MKTWQALQFINGKGTDSDVLCEVPTDKRSEMEENKWIEGMRRDYMLKLWRVFGRIGHWSVNNKEDLNHWFEASDDDYNYVSKIRDGWV